MHKDQLIPLVITIAVTLIGLGIYTLAYAYGQYQNQLSQCDSPYNTPELYQWCEEQKTKTQGAFIDFLQTAW